jgi:hypothetical protein
MAETPTERSMRLRRHLGWQFGSDQEGITPIEIVRKILHTGPGGECRRVGGAVAPSPTMSKKLNQHRINDQIDRDILAGRR